MIAGLRSILHAPGTGDIYHVDLVVDDGPAPDETGFTPWDRATVTGTFTEVGMDTLPQIPYGDVTVSAGALVMPARSQFLYSADDASVTRDWFYANRLDLARGNVYARYYSVETSRRTLDWFGRITARGYRTPVTEATRTAALAVDASCGLSDLHNLPSESTLDVPVGSLIARALCRANPHNTLRIYLDATASNQHVDGSSRTSALHLRASTEWAGPAFVAEGSGEAAGAADGDYGNVDAILDHIAETAGLRVFLDPHTSDWIAAPATALGESLSAAEKVVCGAAVDGGPTWSFEAIAADTWTPSGPEDINDEDAHGFDIAPRLSSVSLDTGGASLVRQPFPTAPVPSVAEADTPADAAETQQLVAVSAEPNRRITLDALFQQYEVPPLSGTFEYPGALRLFLVGFGGTTYWLDAAGAWQTTEQTLGASLSTSTVTVTSTADFPDSGRLYITLVGDDTTGVTVSGDLGYADLLSISLRIKDNLGNVITSWRVIIGESDLPGDKHEADPAPEMEADTDGAGSWAAVTGWESARWSTAQSVFAEYGAEAELRRRAEPLDSFDGVLNEILGPGVRPLLPQATDMADAGTDASSAYSVGSGLVLRPATGDTRGLWFRLPSEAL